MKFLEKDLEEIIFETDNETLQQRGLEIYGKKYRQLRIGNYGVADIVAVHRIPNTPNSKIGGQLLINILELKKDKIGISAFLQAIGYMQGIDSYLRYRGFINQDLTFKITLIGSELDNSSTFCYLSSLLPETKFWQDCSFLSNYTFSYNFDGIEFEEKYGYVLSNEGF